MYKWHIERRMRGERGDTHATSFTTCPPPGFIGKTVRQVVDEKGA